MSDKKQVQKKEEEVICCGYFEQTIKNYQWFSRTDKETGNKLLIMPCFPDNKIRINNCPSCGKEVRNIEIKEDIFNKHLKKTN